MKKLWLAFWLLLLLVMIPHLCLGLPDGVKYYLRAEYQFLLFKSPKIVYGWGAADPYKLRRADCSGYQTAVIREAFKKFRNVGLPVMRTTALEMRLGLKGWTGEDITLDEADELDFVWWTFELGRPHGHIGAFLVCPRAKLLKATHSSARRGVVLDELKGTLMTDISAVRRLTIGDKDPKNIIRDYFKEPQKK